jgi:hypothetical protein
MWVPDQGGPVGFLCKTIAGKKISVADPENPSSIIRRYPVADEPMNAAEALLKKVLPDMKAFEHTGLTGCPWRKSLNQTLASP